MKITNLIVSGICKLLGNPTIKELVVERINGLSKEELASIKGLTNNVQVVLDDVGSDVIDMETSQDMFKTIVADAINKKNGEENLSKDSKLLDFTTKIEDIETGKDVSKVTASANDVLTGKVFVDKTGAVVNGSMPDQRGKTLIPSSHQVSLKRSGGGDPNNQLDVMFTPTTGYYDGTTTTGATIWLPPSQVRHGCRFGRFPGSGENDSNSIVGTYTSDGTADASHILKGKVAYVKGNKVTGTMVDYTGVPNHIDARRIANNRVEFACAKGYHNYHWAGNSYEYVEYSEMASLLGIAANKLVQGVSICGVSGNRQPVAGYWTSMQNGKSYTFNLDFVCNFAMAFSSATGKNGGMYWVNQYSNGHRYGVADLEFSRSSNGKSMTVTAKTLAWSGDVCTLFIGG